MPHDARLRGSQCAADGKFTATRRGARQEQVGDVRAGDQQHKSHGSEQYQERRADIAYQIVVQRNGVDPMVLVVLGILAGQAGGNGVEFRLRLLRRDTLLQATDNPHSHGNTAVPEYGLCPLTNGNDH